MIDRIWLLIHATESSQYADWWRWMMHCATSSYTDGSQRCLIRPMVSRMRTWKAKTSVTVSCSRFREVLNPTWIQIILQMVACQRAETFRMMATVIMPAISKIQLTGIYDNRIAKYLTWWRQSVQGLQWYLGAVNGILFEPYSGILPLLRSSSARLRIWLELYDLVFSLATSELC